MSHTMPTTRHRGSRFYRSTAAVLFGIAAMIAFLVFAATVRADKPGASKTDPRLAGIWKVESGVHNGKPIPEEELKGVRTIVRENAIVTYDRDEKMKYRGVYFFDQSKDPNTIDLVSTMPKSQDAKALGIYKVDEDTWTLCYSTGGSERPKTFESPEGSEIMLLKMTRLKQDEPQDPRTPVEK